MMELAGRATLALLLACILVWSVTTAGTASELPEPAASQADAEAIDEQVLEQRREAMQEPQFEAKIDGRQRWTISYGFGSPIGLVGRSLSAGSLSIDQSLQVDLTAEALDALRIEGHFDPELDDALQSLTLYLDTDHWDGVLGDFTVGSISGFSSQRRKTMGAQLGYTRDPFNATAVMARLEGITETRTFIGETARSEVSFSYGSDGDPNEEQPYLRHLDGLFAFELTELYVEELSTVSLRIAEEAALREILLDYGLDYLDAGMPVLNSTELESSSFVVVGESAQTLLLTREPRRLIRTMVKDAIEAHNASEQLTGESRKTYPFIQGSTYELAFLDELANLASLVADEIAYPLGEAIRRRFYDLGKRSIVEDSVAIEVSVEGGPLTPISRPELSDYEFTVEWASGILEIGFPSQFFESSSSSFRAQFSYSVIGGAYNLGTSIVPGTERITVNDSPLDSSDYSIEYEVGLLILNLEVDEEDVIEVEYERFGSGLGGASDYARYIYGLTMSTPASDSMELTATIQAGIDRADSVEDLERVGTMPNRQIVAGVLGTVDLEQFTASFSMGYGWDVFPAGTSDRPEQVNEVTCMAANEDFLFVGTRNGFSVRQDDVWRGYNTSDGLTGRWVRDILILGDHAFLATNAGLTVLGLVGTSPLDRVDNWESYNELDGLSTPSVFALAAEGDTLWLGTNDGLFSVPMDDRDRQSAWTRFDPPGTTTITSLAANAVSLYIGTSAEGVFVRTLGNQAIEPLAGTRGLSISEIRWDGEQLLVSSDDGLLVYEGGSLVDVLGAGSPVSSSVRREGEIWYATANGVFNAARGELLLPTWPIAQLAMDTDGELWAGGVASSSYALNVWQVTPNEVAYGNETTKIDGRDPSRYLLISEDEYTNEGIFGQASFGYNTDALELSGDFSTSAAGYRAIGESARPGATSWSLHAAGDPGPYIGVAFDHDFNRRSQQDGSPFSQSTNNLTVDSAFPENSTSLPDFGLSLGYDFTNSDSSHNGIEARATDCRLRLSDSFLSDRVDASLSWNGRSDWGYLDEFSRKRNSIGASASIRIWDDVALDGSFQRSLQTSQGTWSGSESASIRAEWAPTIQSGSLTVEGEGDLSRAIGGTSLGASSSLTSNLRIDTIKRDGREFTPTLKGSLALDRGGAQVEGQGLLRTTSGDVTITTTLGGELSGLGTSVHRGKTSLSLAFNHSGEPEWIPTVSYTLTRNVTTRKGVGQAVLLNHSLTGRSTLQTEIYSNRASLTLGLRDSGTSNRLTGHFDNEYRRSVKETLWDWLGNWGLMADDRASSEAYPTASLTVNLDGDFRLDRDLFDADASLSAGLSVAFTEMWSASLSGSYLAGTTGSGTHYSSYVLELSLGVDFQLVAP